MTFIELLLAAKGGSKPAFEEYLYFSCQVSQ